MQGFCTDDIIDMPVKVCRLDATLNACEILINIAETEAYSERT